MPSSGFVPLGTCCNSLCISAAPPLCLGFTAAVRCEAAFRWDRAAPGPARALLQPRGERPGPPRASRRCSAPRRLARPPAAVAARSQVGLSLKSSLACRATAQHLWQDSSCAFRSLGRVPACDKDHVKFIKFTWATS